MFEDGENACQRPAVWVLVGPMYAPAQWLLDQGIDMDDPVAGQGFIGETWCCNSHLEDAQEWFMDPDIHTVRQALQLQEAAGSLAELYGCPVVTVRAVPA